ncbi:apses-domain-containing protein [Microthyrium microscopicum]|uniref:Apses-domain-containing protein n=1 Tax=Microthyrium microscopicum TaxID=703497 RepID=A0A6A6UB97_9PEZI|nr:apses-domain-containing protein [Microthyrium microscopicum]
MSIPPYDPRNVASFTSSQDGNGQMMYGSQQSAMSSYRSSFPDMNGGAHQQMAPSPQIYTAVYSGVQVYEMVINRVVVMRRRSDSWLNATQILKVAGVDKGKRTKVLEKEILTGEHEKVQGGYGKYQGTWINYRRGREFCRQYGVEELLRPLLDYDLSADGSGQPGNGVDTPTKEQAMAANRKRLYTQTQDGRQPQGPQGTGTFFSNLSSAASNAISAMNRAARLNTPPQRPASAPRRPGSAARSFPNSQESMQNSQQPSSQRSNPGLHHERSFNGTDSAYITQQLDRGMDSQEPPRKRMRPSTPDADYSHMNGESQSFIRDGSPTEANESFLYRPSDQAMASDGDVPIAYPPLPHPSDKSSEEKQSLLLDLFADLHRTDYTNHPAILHLSGPDLDLPLDQSANTALHWAATLARIPLMKLLIAKGASIFRGNIAGETPLMAAVQVNNCLDHTCFPDLLELLNSLIEIRDSKGRTILHHIALASGIRGRNTSSKYYLEALLEFLVRRTNNDNSSSSFDGGNSSQPKAPIGLMRFMSEMVNARDMAGNTALNLVARIGNSSIIRQLVEVQADPTIPNHKGLRPVDFGVEPIDPESSEGLSQRIAESPKSKVPSKAEEVSQELMPTLTTSMTQTSSQFSTELRLLQDRIDKSTHEIRDLSSKQKVLTTQVDAQTAELQGRQERKQRIQNLRRAVGEIRDRIGNSGNARGGIPSLSVGDADSDYLLPDSSAFDLQDPADTPDPQNLNSQIGTYNQLLASLNAHLMSLKARDTELESKYRKVVSLCTGVAEDEVDPVLPQLVQAVESEPENDVGRVREFLKRVEAVTGA